MMILNALFFLIWCISVNTHYILYYSDIRQGSYPTFDCLYAYLIDAGKEAGKRYIRNYHLIPYCRRPDDHDNENEDKITYTINENIAQTINFKELKKQNITSEQLLQWFAPIDVAEKYQMNINDTDVFHNCSSPWFGSRCQYKFSYDLSLSFGDIVQVIFTNRSNMPHNVSYGTCYRFLTGCNRGLWPLCFDWHEICDGKIDCMNGEDEQWCNQLEISQCTDDEYRCHYGGQCIPLSFLRDSRLSIDCLDGSDEQDYLMKYTPMMNTVCFDISTFRCQERISRYLLSFQCGDGSYLIRSTIPNDHTLCKNKRDRELSRSMLTSMDHISNVSCQKAFYCALHFNRTFGSSSNRPADGPQFSPIIEDVWNEDCEPLSQHCFSKWLVIPLQPILFGLFQFVYLTNRSVNEFKKNIAPDFVCFNAQNCPMLLAKIVPIDIINGLICCHLSNLTNIVEIKDFNEIRAIFLSFNELCWTRGIDQSCRNSSYFHCDQSMKCIPYYRVGDGISDCFFKEDELFNTCQLNDSNRIKCQLNSNTCLMQVAIGNGLRNCPSKEDEVFIYAQNLITLVSFPDLCNLKRNDKLDLLEIIETDETNCHLWPCHNPYTHCDQHNHCPNGADELNCPDTKCSFNEYECDNEQFRLFYCIPLSNIYEKYLDYCNDNYIFRTIYFYNRTINISKHYFSWNNTKCINLDKLCRIQHHLQTTLIEEDICLYQSKPLTLWSSQPLKIIQNNENLCHFKPIPIRSTSFIYFFKVTRLGYLPTITIKDSITTIFKINQTKKITNQINTTLTSYCHRGIPVFNSQNNTIKCFCPPNYFGSQCQWQNQRISLTIQLIWRGIASINVIFQLIIMIIDQDGHTAPYYEQITYIPNRDCNTKFNIYLIYPNRPKSLSKNYSIRIDLYEKSKLNYWSSWYISIPFQFLPVNRIVTQLIIPQIPEIEQCNLSCGQHGQCRRYINNKSLFFCQCNQGYSASQCQIKHQCNCANHSFCFNSSICICPLYKFGLYCHLTHSICQSSNNPCENNGICVPTDDRISLTTFTCFCPDDYSGERCQNKNNRIDIYLDETIISNISLLLLHFITAFQNAEHERITLLKKIPYDNKNVTVYVTQPFNILFIQIPNQYYYLTVLREIFIPSEHIYTKISSKQRCYSINELLNKTFLEYEYLRRVKYYPLICRQNLELMCFYDDDLMCICDLDRFSNCFLLNNTMNNDCQGYNYCQNDGQCFQNNETCPTKSICICQDCYYGSQCQFSTKSFIFSLDSILGYHIKPNISINQQPLIIKISIAISTIMFLTGFFSGFLSFVTFRRKIPREVGTGNYLLISSILSIIMIIVLTIKFWQLILFQMSLINNRSFLYFNCISIDVSLRIILSSIEWLNACVAFERMISVVKGTAFHKRKSQKISKWIIISVFILTIFTHIHDPINRELIDDIDIDQKRIWCFVRYSSSVEIYNSFVTLFHFLVPFIINIICALWIIKSVTHNRATVRPEQSFQQHLQHEIHQHRHILFAPCILIFLSLPRLIISFVSGCMRSARSPWLYLIGYFISFIPSMLIFFVFVLPSKNYKNEFKMVIQQIIRRFRTNL